MRRIVMFNRVSADGYFASADGQLDWAGSDEEIDRAAVASIARFDAILFGHRTYQMFESFWPHVLDESPTAPSPHGPARRSPELKAMAVMLNESTKYVFSRTRKRVTWNHSHVLGAFDPRAVDALKHGPGKDILVFGSGTIVSLLTQHGLIDEYQLVVSPILLGDGRALIRGVSPPAPLRLLEATPYASGSVLLRYAPARPA